MAPVPLYRALLSLMNLIALFTRTNAYAEETGDDDEGGLGELNFTEFIALLARIANAKFPPTDESAAGFEETWKTFLGLLFVPRYKKLLKAKRQGAGRLTVDGKSF